MGALRRADNPPFPSGLGVRPLLTPSAPAEACTIQAACPTWWGLGGRDPGPRQICPGCGDNGHGAGLAVCSFSRAFALCSWTKGLATQNLEELALCSSLCGSAQLSLYPLHGDSLTLPGPLPALCPGQLASFQSWWEAQSEAVPHPTDWVVENHHGNGKASPSSLSFLSWLHRS